MIEYIRYSKKSGFTGITPKDKEQWMRKYPHIDDFELTVQEGEDWLSKKWDKARLAEQKPRDFLDWWLGCEWENLSKDKYTEPEKIYNPKQLSNFIEQYFINGELIKRITRGKHNGYSDSLATKHYERALGHAIKLREEVPDFPKTPDATGKPHLDLRRFQEWCIECQGIEKELLSRVTLDYVEEALSILQELRELLKSSCPSIDEKKWGEIKDRIWNELERLIKIINESGETIQGLSERMILGHDCGSLISKMTEYKVHVPNDLNDLVNMISAAESIAQVDWDKIKTMVEDKNSSKAPDTAWNGLLEQESVLRTAQIAEQKIQDLVWKSYCHENQEFTEAVNKRQGQIEALFNNTVDVLNSDETLLKVAFLRDEKSMSSFKILGDSLFNISTVKIDNDNVLHEIIDELEAIRDGAAKYDVITKPTETKHKTGSVDIEKPTEIMQYPETHKEFLTKVANTIHELVQDVSNRKQFQVQLSSFRKSIDKFARALKKAQDEANADPKLRYDYDEVRDKDKDPPKPPKEGYGVESYHVLDNSPKEFWRPPLPFNPDGWLSRFQCRWLGFFHPPAEEPRNIDDMLMCEYALLAAIHDEALDIPACDRLTDRDQDDWVEPLWGNVSHEGKTADDFQSLPDRQKYIEIALNDVKADLAKQMTGDDEMPSHYVPCIKIAGIIRMRSDAVARTLKSAKYPVVKKARKNYCDPEHAAVLFLKWKKYLKKQQGNE